MNQKEKQIIGDFAEIHLLQKFLNSHKRLGMTEEEQKAEVKRIEEIGRAIAQ